MKAALSLGLALVLTQGALSDWVWTRLDKVSPPSVHGHSLAYDSRRGRMVMFGGNTYFEESSGNQILNAVWEWDGEEWHEMKNSGLPQPFAQGAMAYDSKRGKTVYVGGWTSGGSMGPRTYEWDGTTWEEHLGSTHPSARYDASMAFDEKRGVCVLFGGSTGSGLSGETWEFDGVKWRLVSTEGPTPRVESAMVYDSVEGRVVLHGGSPGFYVPALSDTWAWDGAGWTQLSSNNRGPALVDHAAAFDAVRNEIVVTFGHNNIYSNTHGPHAWVFKGSTWSPIEMGSVPVRNSHAAIYHPGIGAVILFGGRGNRRYSDLWLRQGDGWVSDDPTPPSYRGGSLAFDAARGNYVYFGGVNTHDTPADVKYSNETWIHDGRWRRVFPLESPTARSNARVVYDEVSNETMLIGGGTPGLPGSRIVEMWAWNGTNWRRINAVGGVPQYLGLAWFDSAIGNAAVLSSRTSYENLTVWTWDGDEWIDTGVAAPANFHAVAYDRTNNVALFLDFQNRTWRWNGTSFSLSFTDNGANVERPAFVFDNVAGKAIRYGGHIAFGGSTSWASTWEGLSWANVGAQPPGGRSEAAFASTPVGAGLVFGGWSHSYGGIYREYYDDTWAVEWRE